MDTLTEAFPRILEHEPSAKLLLVGDGSLRSELEDWSKGPGVARHVIITGYQPWLTMPLFLNLADVCINVMPNTPQAHDIFSAKIIQYLACGKPVVATRTPGLTGSLPGEDAGVVYTDSPDELAEAIVGLLGDRERRERLGDNGTKHVKAHYDAQLIAAQFEEMLEKLVSARRK